MRESELSKKLTKAIRAIDKLVSDMERDARKAMEALKELKEHGKDEEKKGV